MKLKLKNLRRAQSRRVLSGVQIATLLLATMLPLTVQAEQLENRSLQLSTSAASATNVDYTFTFDTGSTSDIGSFVFEVCSNDPFPNTACDAPTGFDGSGATAVSDLGTAGIVSTSGANDNVFTVPLTGVETNVPAETTIEVVLSGITNPSASNEEFWARLYTHADTGASDEVDSGGIAFSTAETIQVTARVQETLSFCVYTGVNCNAGGNLVDLGILNTTTTETDLSYFDVATNARNGVTIQYFGQTLSSGGLEITAFNGGDGGLATSDTGTEQFGLRIDSATTGGQNATIAAPFNTAAADEYALQESGFQTVGESTAPVELTTFTVEYAANVAPLTATGVYTTQIQYIATASF